MSANKIFVISGLILLTIALYKVASRPRIAERPVLGQRQGANAIQGEYERFLDCLASVESGGNPQAIGDGGRAVGIFQLWKIYVDDVNRIIGKPQFDYADRLNPDKSRAMVKVYLNHYATEKRLGRPATFEDMARIHNGGPNGYKKSSTVKYWQKIKRRMQ